MVGVLLNLTTHQLSIIDIFSSSLYPSSLHTHSQKKERIKSQLSERKHPNLMLLHLSTEYLPFHYSVHLKHKGQPFVKEKSLVRRFELQAKVAPSLSRKQHFSWEEQLTDALQSPRLGNSAGISLKMNDANLALREQLDSTCNRTYSSSSPEFGKFVFTS